MENVKIVVENSPNIEELTAMLERAFDELEKEDKARFDAENNGQSLREWFGIDELVEYLKYCRLLEARDKEGKLVGMVLIGKQNPLTWPDGNKVEMFALAVDPGSRKMGLGSLLVKRAEEEAKNVGAKKIILNTHISLEADQRFYERLGYARMGVLKDYYGNGDAVFYGKNLI